MNKEIKEILDILKKCFDLKDENFDNYISLYQLSLLLSYITNLQQENERLKDLKGHYLKYRSSDESQKEVYEILELPKDSKNLHKHKNTGGLLWFDIPMTKFSCISSYIRSKDLALEDYKSRCEKAIEYIKEAIENDNYFEDDIATDISEPSYDKYVNSNSLLNILQNGSEDNE